MKTGDLFQQVSSAPKQQSEQQDKISLASHRLAVEFTEEDQQPVRYRRRKDSPQKIRKTKEDSDVEKRFRANVQAWKNLIETMLAKLTHDQAWRFINLNPQFDRTIKSVTDNGDFCAFIDYLILRRDKENCDSDELGCLAQLSGAFQREVEKLIGT
jgi:hypothetical protein